MKYAHSASAKVKKSTAHKKISLPPRVQQIFYIACERYGTTKNGRQKQKFTTCAEIGFK